MALSAARLAAFHILLRIERDGVFAVDLLHSQSISQFSQSDQRLATELVYGVLRQQRLLDWYLARFVNQPIGHLDVEVMMTLRLGAYQILFLSRVPLRASVHQSVELVKEARKRSAAGLVNAVLRRINKEDFALAREGLTEKSSQSLSVLYSHPEWVVRRWVDRWGLATTLEILKNNNQSPKVHFRSNSPSLSSVKMLEILKQEGISVRLHALGEDIWEVVDGSLHHSRLFQSGEIVVQDAGSQVIPHLLDIKPTDFCLDFCSGAGGKASRMAQLGKGRVRVIGVDSNWHRLQIAKRRHETRWRRLSWVVANGIHPLPFCTQFDKVLVDVICSGSGTLRRNPEIRWRLVPEDLSRLASLQSRLLTNAASLVRKGGILVYATCSLEPEENEQVVYRFLSAYPRFVLETSHYSTLRLQYVQDQFFRLLPPQSDGDGFFAASFRKHKSS